MVNYLIRNSNYNILDLIHRNTNSNDMESCHYCGFGFMMFNVAFQQSFSYILAVNFIGGGNRRTCRYSLTYFIT